MIGHYSVILYQIPTKLGTEICFNESFKCTKVQFDQNRHLYVTAVFAKYAKEVEKKTKKKLEVYRYKKTKPIRYRSDMD